MRTRIAGRAGRPAGGAADPRRAGGARLVATGRPTGRPPRLSESQRPGDAGGEPATGPADTSVSDRTTVTAMPVDSDLKFQVAGPGESNSMQGHGFYTIII